MDLRDKATAKPQPVKPGVEPAGPELGELAETALPGAQRDPTRQIEFVGKLASMFGGNTMMYSYLVLHPSARPAFPWGQKRAKKAHAVRWQRHPRGANAGPTGCRSSPWSAYGWRSPYDTWGSPLGIGPAASVDWRPLYVEFTSP